MPVNELVGMRNYNSVLATRNWKIAFDNLLVFGCGFVVVTMLTGLLLPHQPNRSLANLR